MGAKNRVMSDAVNLLIEKFNNSEKDDKRNLLKQLSSISDIRVVEPILKASIDESNPSFAYFAKKSLRIVRKNLKDQNIDIDSHLKKLLLKREWDALDSENYKRRVKAVQNLSKGKNEKVFKRLVEMLKTETHLHVLATLVKAVARTGGSRALGHLKKYLENEDERLRANTIEALEIIEVREAFEIIKLYLKDPQRRVKVNVAKALWHYSKLEALEQFSIMLKSEVKEDKISAIFSLSSIISLDARKLLQLMLNDIDIEIRLQASVAVSKLDEKLNKLINEGKTGNEVKVYKTMAIGESLDQSKEEVDGFNTLFEKITKADNYQEKINILQELAKVTAQEGNFTKLLEWVKKNDNRFVLATAAKTLAHFNSSGKFNDEYFKYCSEVLLKNPDERVRANTVEALQSFASKEVFEIILPFLNDKSNRVKANSIKLLWSFDRKRSSDQIVKMIKSRDHFQIESVTFILNQLKGEDAEKLRNLLISQAKDDDMKVNVKLEYTTQIKKDQTEKTKEDVFSEFLDNLSGVEEISNEVIEKNMSLLESGTRDEKIKSSRILGSLGSKAILSFLTELMDKEKDEYVVASLAKTIGQVGGEDAISSLANIIKHPDSRVRANVIEGFGYIDSDKICKFMEIALYDSDNRVQANAINVLWERDQKKAIDRINKMIFSSEPWVRRSAIYVLGQIQNEESIKLLRELLNDQDIDVAIYASENLEKISLKVQKEIEQKEKIKYLKLDNFSDKYIEENIEDIVNEIFSFIKSDNIYHRKQAFENLKSILDLKHFEIIKQKMLSVENKYTLATLVKVIGSIKKVEIVDIISPFLGDIDSRVRSNTIEALYFIPDTKKYKLFYPMLHDEDNRVFANAMYMLWNSCTDELIDMLMVRIQKNDDLQQIKYVLGKLDDPSAARVLKSIEYGEPLEDISDEESDGVIISITNEISEKTEETLLPPKIDEKVEEETPLPPKIDEKVEEETPLPPKIDEKVEEETPLPPKIDEKVEEETPFPPKIDMDSSVSGDKELMDEIDEDEEKNKKTKKKYSRKIKTDKSKKSKKIMTSVKKKKSNIAVYVVLLLVIILGLTVGAHQLGYINFDFLKNNGQNVKNNTSDGMEKILQKHNKKINANKILQKAENAHKKSEFKKSIKAFEEYKTLNFDFNNYKYSLYQGLNYFNVKKYSHSYKLLINAIKLNDEKKDQLKQYFKRIKKYLKKVKKPDKKIEDSSDKKTDIEPVIKPDENKKQSKLVEVPSGKIIRFKTKLSSDLKKAIELFNSGNEDDAIKIYISILKSEPANPEANEKVGYYYFDSGEMEKARNYILKSLKYTRNRSELYFIMGDILKDERRNKSSLNFYLKGLELNRDDYVSKYKIGEIYNLLGDYGSAIKYLKEIPDDFNGAVSYQLAKANLHKGDLEGAKKLFHHLKEKYPDQVYGFLGLGKLEFIKKEYYSSIKILKIAYEIDKNNFEVKKYLAMDYNLTGQIGKAERVFPSASSGEIKDLELSLAFAIGYMKSRNYNSSEDVLLNVITEFPDHYRAYFLLGNTFKAQNRNEEAIANYDNALKRTKNADEIAEIKENME